MLYVVVDSYLNGYYPQLIHGQQAWFLRFLYLAGVMEKSVINDMSSNWTFTASTLERLDNPQSLSTPPPILGREKNKKT